MKRFLILLFMFVSSTIALHAQLHPFYEQNGDCYLLIGNGDKKGVYALNNLTTGIIERLYDPLLAYGLSATQKWNEAAGTSEKTLWTFASNTGKTNVSLMNKDVERRVLTTGSMGVWGFTEIAPYVVHRIHSDVNSAPSGRGNHGWGQINSFFEGRDTPCNIALRPVPGKAGYYYITAGVDWYHAYDAKAWSPWTYVNGSHGFAAPSGVRSDYPGDAVYYSRTNSLVDTGPSKGPWTNICCSAGTYGMSGWAHKVRKENLTGDYIDMVLRKFIRGVHNSTTGSVIDRAVANDVLVAVNGTASYRGECTDGCIRAQDGVAMPGQAQPVLQCVYSTIPLYSGGRSYLYRRDVGATSFDLVGLTAYDKIIGDGSDTTCEHMGASSKDADGNYIYLVGLKTVRDWFTKANATGMVINEITDVAVSDQWWQKGGIVYVYDRTQSKVFAFTRDENATIQDTPKEIYVKQDGILPDKIGSDGFGSLYMIRTEFEPAEVNAENFKDGDEYSREYVGVDHDGVKYFRAIFRQGVYKTVFQRPYETGIIGKISSRLLLGYNYWYRYYYTSNQLIDTKPKAWSGSFYQIPPIIEDNVKTELGVINSPTPPRPGDTTSVLDLIGPLTINSNPPEGTGIFSVASPSGVCASCSKSIYNSSDASGNELLYCMQVENAPYFDINGLNIANTDTMLKISASDGDEFLGRFPYTIKKDTIKYYWKIIQVVDKDHKATGKVLMDMEAKGETGNSLLVIPSSLEGRLKVGVKMTYRYYDYTKLGVGKLASEKEETLYPKPSDPPLIAGKDGSPTNVDADGYAWNEIEIVNTTEPVPAEAGVLMAGTDYGNKSSFKPGPVSKGYGCSTSCGHAYCNSNEQNPATTKFIMDGYSICKFAVSASVGDSRYHGGEKYKDEDINKWGLYIRDTKYNYSKGVDRIAQMFSDDPPDPNDPKEAKKESGETRAWELGNMTWNAELKKGSEVIFRATPIRKNIPISGKGVSLPSDIKPYLTLEDLRGFFPIVSEPYSYHVTVDINRPYSYNYFETIRIPVDPLNPSGESVEMHLDIPRIINLKISAECDVVVVDNTPPGEYVYKAEFPGEAQAVVPGYYVINKYLRGTTGETLQKAESTSTPPGNPANVSFVVVDNNMFANDDAVYTGTREDQFHYKATDKRLARLKVGFRRIADNTYMRGLFKHETASVDEKTNSVTIAEVPPSGIDASNAVSPWDAYVLTPTPLSESEVNALGITYYNKLSYVKYDMPVSKMNYFRKKADGSYDGIMDYRYANSLGKDNFKNLLYGLTWKEACYRQENSVNKDPLTDNLLEADCMSGQITIIDNERPTGVIIAKQDKYFKAIGNERKEYYSPNIKPVSYLDNYKSKWLQVSTDCYNGPEEFFGTTLEAGYHNMSDKFAFLSPSVKAYTDIFVTNFDTAPFTEDKLEVDVPVEFTAEGFDNISKTGYLQNNGIALYDEAGKVLLSKTASDSFLLQYVFREPGKYYIIFELADKAKGYPSKPDIYSPIPEVKKAAEIEGGNYEADIPNIRRIRADFEIFDTKLDLKVIERQNQKIR